MFRFSFTNLAFLNLLPIRIPRRKIHITHSSLGAGTFFLPGQSGKLNPYWVSGFSDAEGCFSVIISQRPNLSWRVQVSFEINLHTKDIAILYGIQNFFGAGLVSSRLVRSHCVYRVTKIEDIISVIIPHFFSYPLLSHKYSDFILWSKVANIMHTKNHLTTSGFSTILDYYYSINLGMSKAVSAAFPNIADKPKVEKVKPTLPTNLNAHWVSGFTAGDGGFSIGIRSNTGQIYFRFHIAQHIRDVLLMNLLISFFGCGKVSTRDSRCDFYIQDFVNISKIVIPHFCEYPLHNIKILDFLDFKRAAELFESGGRNKTEEIKIIISNMNSKREH